MIVTIIITVTIIVFDSSRSASSQTSSSRRTVLVTATSRSWRPPPPRSTPGPLDRRRVRRPFPIRVRVLARLRVVRETGRGSRICSTCRAKFARSASRRASSSAWPSTTPAEPTRRHHHDVRSTVQTEPGWSQGSRSASRNRHLQRASGNEAPKPRPASVPFGVVRFPSTLPVEPTNPLKTTAERRRRIEISPSSRSIRRRVRLRAPRSRPRRLRRRLPRRRSPPNAPAPSRDIRRRRVFVVVAVRSTGTPAVRTARVPVQPARRTDRWNACPQSSRHSRSPGVSTGVMQMEHIVSPPTFPRIPAPRTPPGGMVTHRLSDGNPGSAPRTRSASKD